ncbi:hypothetical protein KC887_06955 [Candidatus Kaiserbacteria bacterium]|nr:hypothetical protein [Candidatus Kaiserbacteria bacterium]
MALTHVTAVRNALADAINTAVNAGSGAGQLVIMTSGDVEVATLTMSDPAFGAASSGAITANAITSDTSATGGTAALFKVQDSDANEVYRGTVTATGGGGDLELSSLAIGSGDTVAVSSLVYTASA